MNRPGNIIDYNRDAWNGLVAAQNRWTLPVSDEIIEEARKGNFKIVLTPSIPVPADWFPPAGAKTLCLASGGGQQSPVLAAAGYDVTLYDISIAQLETDRKMAEKHGLTMNFIEGDMMNMAVIPDATFDFVFNPCSTGFIPDVTTVYREVARVLKPGGVFMTGFTNPVFYLFDINLADKGEFVLKYIMPYNDLQSLSDEELSRFTKENEPLVFGHSLEDLIGGQLNAGMVLTSMFEDDWGGTNEIDRFMKTFIATRAVRK